MEEHFQGPAADDPDDFQLALSLFVLSTLMTVLTELNREPEGDTHLRLVVRRATSLADRLPESHGDKLNRVRGIRLVHALTWSGAVTSVSGVERRGRRRTVETGTGQAEYNAPIRCDI